MTKPRGRHAKVHQPTDTARTVSDLLKNLAQLIRATRVLLDALNEWFS